MLFGRRSKAIGSHAWNCSLFEYWRGPVGFGLSLVGTGCWRLTLSDFNVYLTKFSTRFDPLFTTGTRLSSLISDRVVATKKWLTFQGFVIAEVDCCNHAMAGSLEVIVPIVHICTGGDCTYCPYPYRIWLYLLSISVLELIVPVVHICTGVDCTCCAYLCKTSGLQHHRVRVLHRQG